MARFGCPPCTFASWCLPCATLHGRPLQDDLLGELIIDPDALCATGGMQVAPSPGADVGGVSLVPVQMWQRASPVAVQMWHGVFVVACGQALHGLPRVPQCATCRSGTDDAINSGMPMPPLCRPVLFHVVVATT